MEKSRIKPDKVKAQSKPKKHQNDSTVTYTMVSSPFRGLSDIGSPRVDGPPVMLVDPYAYVPLPATADSPGYIADSNPEEDEEDPKEDPTDYPTDRDDDDEDEEEP
nr:hypothetical protein [Tanacetum cinerariifolium]